MPLDLFLGQRYRTTDLIGTGGAASVLRATDENLGREVAVKIFRPSVQEDDAYRRQHTETLLLATLNHPGLVTLLDAGLHHDEDGNVLNYIVMELVDGPDLRRTLKSGPLPAVSVASLGADLADALAYIHSQGVIHRDVKPANILLYPQGELDSRLYPKLTDFGIARFVEATVATAHGATIGTANYLSPEQAQGGTVQPSTDIYSLGLVLLESLTGEKAFPGPIVEAAVARLLRDPHIPDALGDDWVQLLRSMTSRLPDTRPAAHEAAAALRLLALEPEAAPAVGEDSAAEEEEVTTGGVTTGNIYIPLPPTHAPSLP